MLVTKQKKLERLRRLLTPELPDNRSLGHQTLYNLIETYLSTPNSSHAEKRRELLLALQSGAPLTGPNGIRRQLAAFDLGFFGKAYLPHYFSKPSPAFHGELDSLWQEGVLKSSSPLEDPAAINKQEGCHLAVAAPRGHAKSTNLTFKDTLHAICYGYKHFILLLSDTKDQAMGFLAAIKSELEENEAFLEDFGGLQGDTWSDNVLITKTDIKVQAKGAGQKVRGLKHKNWRPDLIILDDVENDENVRTPEQRQKLRNWFYRAVSKCGDGYTDFVFIGTVLHYDSLLVTVMSSASYRSVKYKAVLAFSDSPLWDEWEGILTDLGSSQRKEDALAFFHDHRQEMLAGTQVLWEEKLSYYQLMFMKVDEGEASFYSEEQNEPINPEDCLFSEELLESAFYNPSDPALDFSHKDFAIYGFVDPSLGKSKKSDFSAIEVLALHKPTGYMYDLVANIERRHPDVIISDILAIAVWLKLTYNKRFTAFGCEVNQFQWFLKEALAKESARHGIYLPIVEITQTSDKTLRVQTLQPDLKNHYLKLHPGHRRLLEQLKHFPLGDHDDGPDALEGCRSLARRGKVKCARVGKRRFGL